MINFNFMEETCHEVRNVKYIFITLHCVLILICGYREINEANTNVFGQIFKMTEVLFSFLYIAGILEAIRLSFAWSGLSLTTLTNIATYLITNKN